MNRCANFVTRLPPVMAAANPRAFRAVERLHHVISAYSVTGHRFDLLIARRNQTIQRDRIILGRRALFFNQRAQHPRFDWIEGITHLSAAVSRTLAGSMRSATRISTLRSPAPIALDISKNGKIFLSAARFAQCSHLVGILRNVHLTGGHEHWPRARLSSEKLSSSTSSVSKSWIGSRPVSDISTRWTSTLYARLLQELNAESAPPCAPSIIPGISATTKLRKSGSWTTPRFGSRVVNG